jgi:hypothetical protein
VARDLELAADGHRAVHGPLEACLSGGQRALHEAARHGAKTAAHLEVALEVAVEDEVSRRMDATLHHQVLGEGGGLGLVGSMGDLSDVRRRLWNTAALLLKVGRNIESPARCAR